MSLDQVIVVLCTALWLLHMVQLVRGSLRRTWPALGIAVGALAATWAGYFLLERGAAVLAGALVFAFLMGPVLATQAASRALKWGAIRRARALGLVAFVLRPLPAQRIFRRAVEIAWRIDRGEPFSLEAALDELGSTSPAERAARAAAFLSWTNDFAGIVAALRDAAHRRFALRSGMGAIVVVATGETGDAQALVAVHRELVASGALARRHADTAWALLALAAYQGDAELVREHAPEHADDAPPERVAFMIATAEQRAGDPERARRTVEAGLASARRASTRARLRYRLEHPLEPLAVPNETVRADVRQRLEALRTLAPLRLGFGRPAPVTLVLSFSLIVVFVVQLVAPSFDDIFRRFAVLSPFARAPDPYRLLSYAWLHLDAAHLLLNLVGLLVFGRFVERHFGALRLMAVYLAGALAGGAAFLGWETEVGGAIGASGAVLALFGATVARVAVDRAVRTSPQGRRELAFLASIALLQLIVDAFWPQSSGSAHAGGLVVGLVLGALLRPGKG